MCSFYPFEFILGTFLHELVHNSISRHGLKFERKLAEIREACEEQMFVKASIASIPSCAQFAGGDRLCLLKESYVFSPLSFGWLWESPKRKRTTSQTSLSLTDTVKAPDR